MEFNNGVARRDGWRLVVWLAAACTAVVAMPLGTASVIAAPSVTSPASLAGVRYAMPATTAVDGRVFVFGGYDGTNTLSSVEAYTPSSNSWATVLPMPTARYLAAAATGPDGRLYV